MSQRKWCLQETSGERNTPRAIWRLWKHTEWNVEKLIRIQKGVWQFTKMLTLYHKLNKEKLSTIQTTLDNFFTEK